MRGCKHLSPLVVYLNILYMSKNKQLKKIPIHRSANLQTVIKNQRSQKWDSAQSLPQMADNEVTLASLNKLNRLKIRARWELGFSLG